MTDRRSPAREDLCRSAPFQLVRATQDGTDGLTIEGYGAVFNSVTRISGWEGDFEEIIAPGAFRKSLRERTPRMQFDHGQHPLLGSLPLGRWTVAEEDERGLHLIGRLTDNWLVAPFRDAIRDGGVEGMSFRFAVVRDEWTDGAGTKLRDHELADMLFNGAGDRGPLRRTLREVKASEAGPVVWPAYEDTAVGVRSRGIVVIDLDRLREPAQRRQLADVIALAEAATRDGDEPAPPRGQRGRLTLEALLAAGHSPEKALAIINDKTRTETVDAPPQNGTSTGEITAISDFSKIRIENNQIEPQPTAPPADDHPAEAGPEATDRAAGEHSAPTRPLSPIARRDLLRKEFRAYTDRYLDARRQTNIKESA
jgi:uncharacterized protein